jgi:hypothetical protein
MSLDASLQRIACPIAFWRFNRELNYEQLTPGLLISPGYAIGGNSIKWDGTPKEQRTVWEERILKVFETAWRLMMEDQVHVAGEMKRFQSTYIPELDTEGTVVAVLVICCDITAINQWELVEEETVPSGAKSESA